MDEEEITRRIGGNIKDLRNRQRLKQASLASKAQVSSSQLSAFENGKKTPGLITIANIAEGLSATIDEVYYGPFSRRPIATSKNEVELAVNCFAALVELGMFRIERSPCDTVGNSEGQSRLIVWKNEAQFKELFNALEDFKVKSPDYSDPETVKRNILGAAAKRLERKTAKKKRSQKPTPLS